MKNVSNSLCGGAWTQDIALKKHPPPGNFDMYPTLFSWFPGLVNIRRGENGK